MKVLRIIADLLVIGLILFLLFKLYKWLLATKILYIIIAILAIYICIKLYKKLYRKLRRCKFKAGIWYKNNSGKLRRVHEITLKDDRFLIVYMEPSGKFSACRVKEFKKWNNS